MKPIGPLMWEHRLIERMLKLFEGQLKRIREEQAIDVVFIDMAVDFIRTYADRTHHGKEEDILFRDLARKSLSAEHARIMQELVEEHTYARRTVARLVQAKNDFLQGHQEALTEVEAGLAALAEFYPRHIEKEDKHFFFPCLEYFTREEQDAMLAEFSAFDRNMIHEKYTKVVDELAAIQSN